MVREVERDLWELSIEVHPETMQDKDVSSDYDYKTKEVQAYGYTLVDFEKLNEAVEYMKGNMPWLISESQDRVKAEYLNPGESWKLHSSVWAEYIRNGQFAYTYNERFREQLPQVIRELKLRPSTRQAILTMYDRHQDMNNWGGIDRIPCSLHYQFYIRNGKLNLIYSMRSCDFLTHFIHDVFFAIELLRHVAKEVGVPLGTMTHFIGSLHAYYKDMKTRGIF